MLHQFSGATVRRVIDRSRARIREHAHDWPLLSIFVIGAYRNETELGEQYIAGPSAVLYRAGAAHRNTIGADGFEQIEIEFDPAWFGRALIPDAPVTQWLGGRAGAEARRLAQDPEMDEEHFRLGVKRFVERVKCETKRNPSSWVNTITRRLGEDPSLRVNDLAREVGKHPSWLGTAYRRAAGEGLQETAARFRVERAARLLRETDQPYAGIAAEAGFCDQSHMNRTFRRVLRRSPSEVRAERCNFRQ